MSDLPPTAIVEEMQRLDDIEADLADTALAVTQDTIPADAEADAPAEGVTQSEAEGAGDQLLQNAETIEHVLEESISSAPSPSPVPAATEAQATEISALPSDDTSTTNNLNQVTIDQPSSDTSSAVAPPTTAPQGYDPSVPQSVDTYQPQEQSQIATEAINALHAVENDVDVPILPPTVQASVASHDQTMEDDALLQGDGDDEEEMMMENDEEEQKPQQNGSLVPSHTDDHARVPSPLEQPVIIPSNAGLPPKPDLSLPVEEPKIDIDLPTGLTFQSASVVSNPDLLRAWAREPKNPNLILAFFNWSAQKSEVVDARIWYELLAEDEPTAIQPLLALINLESSLSNFSHVEALFAKALKGPSGGITAAADVSIWKAYLHYIRRQNPITEENAEAVRATITRAYEFALKECGTDRESGEIWQEYIAFVAEPSPKNAWDTQAQMDTLRKLYQRAVCIPLNNVEALWKAYDAFESGHNKATAKKFLADKSPAYMTARTALRELRTLTDSLPRPILPPRPTFSEADRGMVSAWKNYLKWEEGNPLVIEDEEARNQRIGYALRKCLGEMRHFPELWHYAINYYGGSGKSDQAAEAAIAGVQACPDSMLLTFALADIEENRRNLPQCHQAYEALINRLNPQIDELKKKVEVEVENAKGPEIVQPQGGDADMDDAMSEVQRLVEERENRGKMVAERRGRDVQDLASAVGIVWVMYMRFARRAEGTISARNVFKKARQTAHPTWQIYEASAMMEYHANKDSAVAVRIFELGLKLFSEEPEYVTRYLQYLLSINDDTNARALFERSTVKIPAEKARTLWDTWARYEYMYGDLAGVHKLEARFAEVFPNDSPLKRFAQRFTYNGLDQIALRDLGFGVRHPPPQAQQFIPPPTQQNSIPVQPPLPVGLPSIPPQQQLPTPPQIKRPLPDDPRRERPPSPSYKRPRAQSPQGRRFTPPQHDRVPSNAGLPPRNFRDQISRDRSPPPSNMGGPLPPGGFRQSVPPPSIPSSNQGYGGYPAQPPASLPNIPPSSTYGPPQGVGYGNLDRSGLSRPLAQFIGSLPSSRSFDGPMFKVHDIIDLFDNIGRDGSGVRQGSRPGPPPTQGGGGGGGYGPPGGGYAPPPPQVARGGYGDVRGYGAPPRGRY